MKSFVLPYYVLTLISSQGAKNLPQNPTKQFEHYYQTLDSLLIQKDVKGTLALIRDSHTADYTHESKPDVRGQRTKRNLKETIESVEKAVRWMAAFKESVSKVEKVSLSPHKAVVTVISSLSGITPKTPNGKNQIMVLYSKSEDTWVQVGSKWKIKVIRTLEDRMTIDGKPVPFHS